MIFSMVKNVESRQNPLHCTPDLGRNCSNYYISRGSREGRPERTGQYTGSATGEDLIAITPTHRTGKHKETSGKHKISGDDSTMTELKTGLGYKLNKSGDTVQVEGGGETKSRVMNV